MDITFAEELAWNCTILCLRLLKTKFCFILSGGGDAQNVDVDLGHFLDVDCRLKGFKKCRIYKEFFEK